MPHQKLLFVPRFIFFLILLPVAVMLSGFLFPQKKTGIFMAGDSTMSIKEARAYPETGWGMPFVYFWDSTVTVVNKAGNGRSTRTFIGEGSWRSITNEAGEGDYVFIQFGHNDEVPSRQSYTTGEEFRANLARYVRESREKRATPVLLTPVARRSFDSTGHITGTHDVYSQITRDVAMQEKVILIDLDKKSQSLYQQMGGENSKLLFLHLKPGEHPNYPEGREDNTHFSELGARMIAQLVLQEIRMQIPGLAARIVKPLKNK